MLNGGIGEFVLRVGHPERAFMANLLVTAASSRTMGLAAMYASGPDMKASKATCGR